MKFGIYKKILNKNKSNKYSMLKVLKIKVVIEFKENPN